MSEKAPPAFQFYPRDWLSSESVRVMTATARGAYITLLCVCWLEGSLPTDDALLCKLSDATFNEWGEVREVVLARFFEKNGRLYQRRLETERAKQRRYKRLQSEKGKKSAASRFNRGSTVVQPQGQPDVNSASASAFASASSDVQKHVEPSDACVVHPAPAPDEGAGERLWEMFRTRAKALRDASLPLSCRQVEMGSVVDFLSRYPDPGKWAWLIDAYLTSRHRPIVAAPISIGQLCKWAPWLEAQATAPAPESPRTAGNRAALDAYAATLKGVTKP